MEWIAFGWEIPAAISLQYLSLPSSGTVRRSPSSDVFSFEYVEFELLVAYPSVYIQ